MYDDVRAPEYAGVTFAFFKLRAPASTARVRSSAASDVYKRQRFTQKNNTSSDDVPDGIASDAPNEDVSDEADVQLAQLMDTDSNYTLALGGGVF